MKKILLSFLLLVPVLAVAQSFQVNLQGQKQIAMVGAGTGLALDEASVFFNPGAVTFLQQNGVQGGVSTIFLKSAFNEAGASLVEYNKNRVATPIQVYGVFGSPENRLRFGLGVYTPFGGNIHWDENWSGKYTVTGLDLMAIYVQPTLSYKITDQIGVGAGFVYTYGHVDLKRAIPLTLSNGQTATAQLKGSSHDFGWNAGIYVETLSGVSIGVTHRSQVTAGVDNGEAIFTVPSSLAAGFPTKFTAELPLPATSTIGLGFHPSEKTTLALDVNWVHWNKYKELAFIYDNNQRIENTRSPRNYKDAVTFRFGVQKQASSKIALRAGVGYALSPVRRGYVTPEVPDANRLLLSAGLGLKPTPRLGIDLSFLYEYVVPRTETNIETGLEGTFKTLVYIPGLSVSYKF